jgi:hypothetical protein
MMAGRESAGGTMVVEEVAEEADVEETERMEGSAGVFVSLSAAEEGAW